MLPVLVVPSPRPRRHFGAAAGGVHPIITSIWTAVSVVAGECSRGRPQSSDGGVAGGLSAAQSLVPRGGHVLLDGRGHGQVWSTAALAAPAAPAVPNRRCRPCRLVSGARAGPGPRLIQPKARSFPTCRTAAPSSRSRWRTSTSRQRPSLTPPPCASCPAPPAYQRSAAP